VVKWRERLAFSRELEAIPVAVVKLTGSHGHISSMRARGSQAYVHIVLTSLVASTGTWSSHVVEWLRRRGVEKKVG
jgi:hypothetical protein